MKQIGTPIASLSQGLAIITSFCSLGAGLAYKAYHDHDVCAGLSSITCLLIAGLAVNNTLALELAGDHAALEELN